jgi:hypothetical protein
LKLLVWVKIGYVKSGLNGEISPNLVTLTVTEKLIPEDLNFFRKTVFDCGFSYKQGILTEGEGSVQLTSLH